MNLVSIVIPTFNRSDLLIQCVDSIVKQTYENWECLVVDDNSTEDIEGIISRKYGRPGKVRYIKNARTQGAQGARNTGMDSAEGQYIIFVDSDDLLSPECLQKRLEFAGRNPGRRFYCFPTAVFINTPFDTPYLWNYLNKESDNDLKRFFQLDMPWHTSGVLWEKSYLAELGGWDENLRRWQDWDMHIQAIMHSGGNYLKIEDSKANIDSFYRKHPAHKSISNTEGDLSSLGEKITAVTKHIDVIAASSDASLKIELARVIFILSQLLLQTNKIDACQFLNTNLSRLGYSKKFCENWILFLFYRYDPDYSRFFRKMFDLMPLLYGQRSLVKVNRTHLRAQY